MEGRQTVISVYILLNKDFSWSRYLENVSLLPIGLAAYSQSNIFYFSIAKQAA
jgi:hypothetical protein